ncbi:MAG TPA: hypothetical protein VJ739_05525 [Gemmataceae bacterium]|nr:hypothetical protein [Gemmataceae bacterium]
MSNQTVSAAPHPTIPPEVWAFARQEGVEQYVPALVELARQVYPSATRFDIFTEDDPEIANDRHIVFELDVPISVDQALAANRRWHDGVFEIVPAPLVCVFRHSAHPRP